MGDVSDELEEIFHRDISIMKIRTMIATTEIAHYQNTGATHTLKKYIYERHCKC